jgi:hypothetical protein
MVMVLFPIGIESDQSSASGGSEIDHDVYQSICSVVRMRN